MIIAVDGPAASGKGTLARKLAAHYGLSYLDTGSLYRAVAWNVLARNQDIHDPDQTVAAARSIDPDSLSDPQLKEPAIGDAASIASAIPEVRTALLNYQRDFASRPPGAVLDGRDIGTVVCPDATTKLFVTAAIEMRARRRFLELRENDEAISEQNVLEDIKKRDERDSSRSVSPLQPAIDAHLLDTTNLDIETAYKTAVELIDAAIG